MDPERLYPTGSYIAILFDAVHIDLASPVLERQVVFSVKKHGVEGHKSERGNGKSSSQRAIYTALVRCSGRNALMIQEGTCVTNAVQHRGWVRTGSKQTYAR